MSVDVARTAAAWADAEGWNPGLDDAERFAAADPEAFLSAADGPEIAGTVSCARYGDRYSFVGFFIVRPELRGRGAGSVLFDRALAQAGARVVGLDGVLAQQSYYERRGFVEAHRNVRWRTTGGGEPPASLVELASVPFEDVIAFDAGVFGAERERFLRIWTDRPAGHALASVDGGRLTGYGVIRPCQVGAKVGPLFAAHEDVAEALVAGLLAAVPSGVDVFVDIPATNERAAKLRTGRVMTPVFETVRMYMNGTPPEDVQQVYGVTTFEFG